MRIINKDEFLSNLERYTYKELAVLYKVSSSTIRKEALKLLSFPKLSKLRRGVKRGRPYVFQI